MSSPSTTDVSDEIVAAAGEFIRSYEAVVTIYELLDELGDRFPGFVTPDMRKLVIKMTTSLLTLLRRSRRTALSRWAIRLPKVMVLRTIPAMCMCSTKN